MSGSMVRTRFSIALSVPEIELGQLPQAPYTLFMGADDNLQMIFFYRVEQKNIAPKSVIEYPMSQNVINLDFNDGAKVEILSDKKFSYDVDFIDSSTGKSVFNSRIENNQWTKCLLRRYIPWNIKIRKNGSLVSDYKLELKGRRVQIINESPSLGDYIAWMPYVE